MNSHKIILHLCAKEGSDSLPYREAGYDVRIIGEEIGVENYHPPENVYGIIANPPCTHFSNCRTNAKEPRNLEDGMRLVKECLRIIWQCQYRIDLKKSLHSSPLRFWMMENPATGYLNWFLGNPAYIYQPYEFGDSYSKKTALWGMFNHPLKPLLYNPIPSGRSITDVSKDTLTKIKGINGNRTRMRSLCSPYFAKAFFEANQ